MTKKEIMDALVVKGVKFNKKSLKADLESLLKTFSPEPVSPKPVTSVTKEAKVVVHTHDKVKGKAALELFAEVRFLNSACCEARYNYLKAQAVNYVNWVGQQDWCKDQNEYARNVVAHIEKALEKDPQGNVSDIQVDTTLEADKVDRQEMIDQLDDEYQVNLEKTVSKSQRNPEAQLWWWKQRIFGMTQELKLHDKIQDALDGLKPSNKPGIYVKFFKRLDELFRVGKLGYDGWVIFSNQLCDLISKPEKKIKPKELHLLPDRLSFYEKRMEEEKSAMEFKVVHEFQERSLEDLDNDLLPVEELVSHIEA